MSNKAIGPDDIRAELIQLISDENIGQSVATGVKNENGGWRF